MRQKVDVLAIFNIDCRIPRPIRFKLIENGRKKTVNVTGINTTDYLVSGGTTRIEYDCYTDDKKRRISYKLMYYYSIGKWEIETYP